MEITQNYQNCELPVITGKKRKILTVTNSVCRYPVWFSQNRYPLRGTGGWFYEALGGITNDPK
jgi:hypothetical protein